MKNKPLSRTKIKFFLIIAAFVLSCIALVFIVINKQPTQQTTENQPQNNETTSESPNPPPHQSGIIITDNPNYPDSEHQTPTHSGQSTTQRTDSFGTPIDENGVSENFDSPPYIPKQDDPYEDEDMTGADLGGKVVYNNKAEISIMSVTNEEMELYIRNNSGRNLIFEIYASVNGCSVNTSFHAEIKDGRQDFETVKFKKYDMENNGISSINHLEFFIIGRNADNEDEIIFKTNKISHTVSSDISFPATPKKGTELYNQNGVVIEFVDYCVDESGLQGFVLMNIKNNSNNTIILQAENKEMAFNGVNMQAEFYHAMLPNTQKVGYAQVRAGDIRKNEIENIESIEFPLLITNAETRTTTTENISCAFNTPEI